MTFRNTRSALGIALIVGVLLTGCGPFPEMVDLTDEDVEAIALYCSHAISKFNLNQDKGLVFVPHDDRVPAADKKKKAEEEKAAAEAAAQEQEAAAAESDDEGTEEPDDVAPPTPEDADIDGNPSDISTHGDSQDAQDSSTSSMETTLTDVLDVSGISFLYKGAKVSTDYRSGDVYDLTPDDGYELLVMRIKARNDTSKDIKLDLTDKGLRFLADYEGQQVRSQATLLLNDLTTYEGTIKAGKTRNLIVLFQFPVGTVRDTSMIRLMLPRSEGTYEIDLARSSKG